MFSIHSNFCISLFPLFPMPFQENMIKNLMMLIKVYDTINWLSKNLRTHVWYNENESRSDIETWSIDRVVNTRVYTRNSFETKIFWKRIITKPCEKLTWFFLLHLVPCYGQDCGKQKHVELVTSLSLHCQEQFIF